VSRPVSPHPPSGVVRGARVPRGNRATESLQRLRALECGRFVLPRLPSQLTGRHRSDRREAFRFREAARRQRRAAESHGSAFRKGPLPHGVRLSSRHRAFVDRLVLARAPEVTSPRHLEAVAGCFGLVRTAGERIARTLFGAREPPRSMRWCQRRCDWNVWTRDPDACNADAPPFLWAGWQRPRMRQLPCGWAEDRFACRACATRTSPRFKPPHGRPTRLERGSSR